MEAQGYPAGNVTGFAVRERSAKQQSKTKGLKAMNSSRRIVLTGLAGLAVAPAMTPAFAGMQADSVATVAEERFARMIAAAHAPDAGCAQRAERYADLHWRQYVMAARVVLDARV